MSQYLDLSKNQDPVPKRLQTPAELTKLVRLAQGGDTTATADLYWRMRPLVYHISLKYGHRHGDHKTEARQEILQQAWSGLAEAMSRWDPDHPVGKTFWSYASTSITFAVKMHLGAVTGGVPMSRYNYEQYVRIVQSLEAAGVADWETLSRDALHAITGVRGAQDIMRALQSKQGHIVDDDLRTSAASAEDAYLDEMAQEQWAEVVAWLRGLEAIPFERWEEATYWKLEQLGLAGTIEAQQLIDNLDTILEVTA